MGLVAIDLIQSAGYSRKGVGAPVFVGRNRALVLTLDVAEILAGDPTLDVTIETAASQRADTWRTLGAFPQVAAVGLSQLSLDGADDFVRARYTPSRGALAFSVAGTAHLVLLAASDIAAAGHADAVDLRQYRAARLELELSNVSGVGAALTVRVETAPSANAAAWTLVETFAVANAVGVYRLTVAGLDRFVRLRWTVAGATPTFTASVSAESLFVLASPAERARLGIRGGAIPDVSAGDIIEALIAATSIVLGYFAPFDLPLRTWGDDLKIACFAVADYLLVTNRGNEPDKQPGAQSYVIRYREYVGEPPQRNGWLDLVRRKEVRPTGLIDSTPPTSTGQVERVTVRSKPLRGYGRGGGC